MTFEALQQLTLPAAAGGGELSLRLLRGWPVSPGQLLLNFADPGGRLLAGQFHGDPAALAEQRQRLEELAPGLARWRQLPAGGTLLLQPEGLDARLEAVRPFLQDSGGILLAHRPGKRAVVRGRWEGGPAYVKFHASARPWRRALAASDHLAGLGLPLAQPRVIASEERRRLIVTAPLAGVSLHERLLEGRLQPAELGPVAAALARLHAQTSSPRPELHGALQEAEVLQRWASLLRAHRPTLLPELESAVAVVLAGLQGLEQDPPGGFGLIHRDFHDKQIFLAASGPGLLDFDTLVLGDPLIDVANLLAHLEWRWLQGRLARPLAAACAQAFLQGYGAVSDEARLQLYVDATRLRRACVYGFRPRGLQLGQTVLPRLGWPVCAATA
ncbi:MAG: aminoglycoside phosphotransferase family protein [Synechococcaceae cyanobacterium]|nr:aminoglycoside phosphotransferase family protein [Synechococcaceae cyanobacterium]